MHRVLTFDLALGYLVGPHAHSGLAVVSQTGGTLVSAGLSSPTVPEGVALDVVWEDSVQSRAVQRADGRFCGENETDVVNATKWVGIVI